MPKKKRQGAFLCALALKANSSNVKVLEDLVVVEPKTKTISNLFKAMNINGQKNLIVVDKYDKNLFLAARNIQYTEIRKVSQLNAYDLVFCETVIFTKKSIEELSSRFGKVGA